MKLRTTLLIALFALCCTMPLEAQIRFEKGSIEAAQRRAKAEQKLLFIDLYASWCPACHTLNRKVFSKRAVGDWMNERFVALRFDVDREPGRTLARDYEVRSIPTMLIFDERGRLLARTSGGRSADAFLEDMQEILRQLAICEEK